MALRSYWQMLAVNGYQEIRAAIISTTTTYSREGPITECLTMLHIGQLLSLSFEMYEITLGLYTAKITDYIKKLFK